MSITIDPKYMTGEKTFSGNGQQPGPTPGNEQQTPDDYVLKFKSSILDQTKIYPEPEPVLFITQRGADVKLLTLKSFSLWQGKQKSKKTTILALAVAAFIADNNTGNANNDGIYTSLKAATKGKVIYFDTEQGESYAARTMGLILKLANVTTSENLIYCDLREHGPGDRRKLIAAGIESTPDVKLVIIDGLVDLLTDFMEAKDGHSVMTEILQMCSRFNIHIAGVLHQNKGDKNARAHIGTIASQKCEIEISTEVDTNDRAQSIVSCVNSRGLPFEEFAIRWDHGHLPRIAEWSQGASADQKESKNYEIAKEAAQRIFKPGVSLKWKEAIDEIQRDIKKSQVTAKRLLADFVTWGFVTKGPDARYRINLSDREPENDPEGVKGHEGSKAGS